MSKSVPKRSVVIGSNRRTSLSLEDEYFAALKEIAAEQRLPLSYLIERIEKTRNGNLSSSVRLYILDYYRRRQDRVVISDELEGEDSSTAHTGSDAIPQRRASIRR